MGFVSERHLKLFSINRRWTPVEMQDLKMFWTADGSRYFLEEFRSRPRIRKPESWNAPETQGPPVEDGGVAMVHVLIF